MFLKRYSLFITLDWQPAGQGLTTLCQAARQGCRDSLLRMPQGRGLLWQQTSQRGTCTQWPYTNIQDWYIDISGQQKLLGSSGREEGDGAALHQVKQSHCTETSFRLSCLCKHLLLLQSTWLACDFPRSFALWPCFGLFCILCCGLFLVLFVCFSPVLAMPFGFFRIRGLI